MKLHEQLNGKEFVVEFDFLGKDSIRYCNAVAVEKRVFKNLQLFVENKQPGDDLFDRLNVSPNAPSFCNRALSVTNDVLHVAFRPPY